MIFPERWADQWIDGWNRRDMESLLSLYSLEIELRSPFAKVYASEGLIKGRADVLAYWQEAIRRLPNLTFEMVKVYRGHQALSMHYVDSIGRNSIKTVLFNDRDEAIFETNCLDRLR
ncbi:hypothetical protein GCM10009087_00440 [Sphingomonas oligophenolica]|uniref:Nuclear transport factor 2 family protein n=1 Tax=Sphingomonas oligophenolica TaxID=301154 RepID=A0ABU9YAF7_9SPHN